MEIKWKHYNILVSFQKQRKMHVSSSGKKKLTGIVTSGVINVFEDMFLKEEEGNLMKRKEK